MNDLRTPQDAGKGGFSGCPEDGDLVGSRVFTDCTAASASRLAGVMAVFGR